MKRTLLTFFAIVIGMLGFTVHADSQTWTFKSYGSDGWLKSNTAAMYLPNGVSYKGSSSYAWQYKKTGSSTGGPCIVGQNSSNFSYPLIIGDVKKGTLTFRMKILNTGNTNYGIAYYSGTTKGTEIQTGTLSKDNFADWTDFTVNIPEDGSVGFYFQNNTWIESFTNEWGLGGGTYAVSGTVTDGTSPLAGATVTLDGDDVSTDATGAYTFPDVANGTYTISVSKEGYTSAGSSVTVNGADVTVPAIALQKYYTVSGTVTSNGTPLDGVAVSLGTQSAVTAADGAFSFANVLAGNYQLSCTKDGYENYSTSVSVTDADVTALAVSMTLYIPKYTVSGTTVTADGTPLSGVSLAMNGQTATSASDGAFSFTQVVDGTYSITAAKTGYIETSQDVTVNGADLTGVTVTLQEIPPFATVSGQVKDQSNYDLISGATVWLTNNADNTTVATTTSDSEGNYSLTIDGTLDAAGYTMHATAPYYSDYNKKYTNGSDLKQNSVVTRNLLMAGKLISCNITVVDARSEAPVTGATVTITPEGGDALTLPGNTNGVYSKSNIKALDYKSTPVTLNVSAQYYVTPEATTFSFDGNSYSATVQLTPIDTNITGVVTDADTNDAIAGATVSLYAGESTEAVVTATTDAEGTYTLAIEGALADAYTLIAGATYYTDATVAVDGLTRGETMDKNIVLDSKVLTLYVDVVNADTEGAVAGATVTFNEVGAEASSAVTIPASGPAGSYALETIKAAVVRDNKYVISVSHPDYYSTQSAEFQFNNEDYDDTVSLTPIPGTVLCGTVTESENAEPLKGATVVITAAGADEPMFTLTTDEDGLYSATIEGALTASSYSVAVTHPDYYAGSAEFTDVERGHSYTADVVLTVIPPTVLTGKVTNALTGEPMSGLRVEVTAVPDDPSQAVGTKMLTTDENGVYTYTINGTPYSSYMVYASQKYFEGAGGDFTDVVRGTTQTVDMELNPIFYTYTATVNGITEDNVTVALEDATVLVTCGDADVEVTNEMLGKYSFTVWAGDATPGDVYVIRVSCEGYTDAEPVSFTFEGKDAEQTFTLNAVVGLDSIFSDVQNGDCLYTVGGVRVRSTKNLQPGIYLFKGRKIIVH